MKKLNLSKPTLVKIIIAAALVLVIAAASVTTVLLVKANGKKLKTVDACVSAYSDSMEDVKTVVSQTVFKDGDSVVATNKTEISFKNGNTADVSVTEGKLNNFQLVETTSTREQSINRNSLVSLNLDAKYMKNAKVENNVLTFGVNADGFKSVVGDIAVFGGTDFELVFDGKKISKVSYEFETDSGKTAVVTVTYGY